MRVLIVSKHFPENLLTKVHGVYKRLQMFVDAINKTSQIDVLFFVPNDMEVSSSLIAKLEHSFSNYWDAEIKLHLCKKFAPNRSRLNWKRYGLGAVRFFKQDGFLETSGREQVRGFESCLSNRPDKIFVHRLAAMCPLLLTSRTLPPVFLDLDDIEHIAFFRSIKHIPQWYKKLLYYTILPALCWGEYKAIQLADRTFVCSEKDRRYLTNRWHLKGVYTIPNAVKIPKRLPATAEQTLLFIGSYFHKPNINAAEFLIQKIWPHVHKALPDATLIIAGFPPDRIPSYRLDTPGIRFPGFVDNLANLYRQSRVVCAPILFGSGTRLKILEAAAYGKPIVSTQMGAEGIQMRNGREILLCDDPKRFAESCVRLLKDQDLCDRLGSAACAAVAKKYDQVKVKRLIQKHFKNENDKRIHPSAA